jgi:hypothetical protein
MCACLFCRPESKLQSKSSASAFSTPWNAETPSRSAADKGAVAFGRRSTAPCAALRMRHYQGSSVQPGLRRHYCSSYHGRSTGSSVNWPPDPRVAEAKRSPPSAVTANHHLPEGSDCPEPCTAISTILQSVLTTRSERSILRGSTAANMCLLPGVSLGDVVQCGPIRHILPMSEYSAPSTLAVLHPGQQRSAMSYAFDP